MANNVIGCYKQWHRLNRMLFLLFVVVFTTSPILDAFHDFFYYSPVASCQEIYDSDDLVFEEDLKHTAVSDFHFASKSSSKGRYNDLDLAQLVSRINGPRGCITKPQLPTHDSCLHQRCSFVSSDPSPPVM